MKTLFKTYTWQKARKKQQEREQETGIKFSVSHHGAGYSIVPVITERIPYCAHSDAMELLDHIGVGGLNAVSFVKLVERSGLELKDVMSRVKTLTKMQYTIPTVDRMGKWSGVYRSQLK